MEKCTLKKLREMATECGIPIARKTKAELINEIPRYHYGEEIGEGKEGKTYCVKDMVEGREYALKKFRKSKSLNKIVKEAELQKEASQYKISPYIVEVDPERKAIIMEKMDYHLYDLMKKKRGHIVLKYQKEIIEIFKILDKARIFHGDSNILNFMLKEGKIYMIDFGMSKKITRALEKKLGTSTPNLDIMTLGLILKLKELGCPKTAYSYLSKYISPSEKERFGI